LTQKRSAARNGYRTHFRREGPALTDPWRWVTETDQGLVVEEASESYRRFEKALVGFLIWRGYQDWIPAEGMFSLPAGYRLEKVASGHYVVIEE
jgi:hypothetical protein